MGETARAGALIAYGPNYTDLFRRAAEVADKIMRGAKPGDITSIKINAAPRISADRRAQTSAPTLLPFFETPIGLHHLGGLAPQLHLPTVFDTCRLMAESHTPVRLASLSLRSAAGSPKGLTRAICNRPTRLPPKTRILPLLMQHGPRGAPRIVLFDHSVGARIAPAGATLSVIGSGTGLIKSFNPVPLIVLRYQ